MQFVCSIVANALICETEGSSVSCTVKDLEKLSKMCNRQDQTIWSASSVLQSKISSAVIQIKYCLTAATLCSVAGVSIGLRGEEKKNKSHCREIKCRGKKSTFVRSPSIFYYDFCVIPPQHSYKAKQLLSVGTQTVLGELQSQPWNAALIYFFFCLLWVVFCVPLLFTPSCGSFLFFLFFPPSLQLTFFFTLFAQGGSAVKWAVMPRGPLSFYHTN